MAFQLPYTIQTILVMSPKHAEGVLKRSWYEKRVDCVLQTFERLK